MDRPNPFSSSSFIDDNDPFTTSYNRSSPKHNPLSTTTTSTSTENPSATNEEKTTTTTTPTKNSSSSATAFANSSRYTTSFPDPFKDVDFNENQNSLIEKGKEEGNSSSRSTGEPLSAAVRPSNVTFAPNTSTTNTGSASMKRAGAGRRQVSDAGTGTSFGSFLSRATSVTSSSMLTDRVSGAVGTMKSAVDSISSQIQSVPANINERLSSTANSLIGSSGGGEKSDQPDPSATGYLASKFSSATNQFTSSSSPSLPTATASAASAMVSATPPGSNSLNNSHNFSSNQLLLQSQPPIGNISRQRVILILDSLSNTDWAQQFNQYYKLINTTTSGTTGGGVGSSTIGSSVGLAQSAISSFFSSATAQLSGSVGASNSSSLTDGGDLIEQADFKDVSVLANQSSCSATVYVTGPSASYGLSITSSNKLISSSSMNSSSLPSSFKSTLGGGKVIRPEYVVIRERTKDNIQHLRNIVSGFNYCMVTMFEPMEVWEIFQDRQMIFSKLLRVQKTLGKEHFPLVPQLYCQTHQDLLNYINNNSSNMNNNMSQKNIMLPCFVCTGPSGKGKLRIENLQTLREFSSIMATNGLSCTIEQYLNVKSDLILQKLGTSLKLFRRNISKNNITNQSSTTSLTHQPVDQYSSTSFNNNNTNNSTATTPIDLFDKQQQQLSQEPQSQQHNAVRQSASRQTSLGSGVLSSLIPTSSSTQQQTISRRRSSNPIGGGGQFERLAEVSARYRSWIEAIQREFDNKLEAFCVKIVVTTDDREYIVGLSDCSMNFLGNQENQEEDKRSFVELIISNMNTVLPKHHHNNISRQSSSTTTTTNAVQPTGSFETKRTNSCSLAGSIQTNPPLASSNHQHVADSGQLSRQPSAGASSSSSLLTDKKKFISQTQMNGTTAGSYVTGGVLSSVGSGGGGSMGSSSKNNNVPRTFGQLSSRSQSVSMNQYEFLADQSLISKSPYFARRGSDRSDTSLTASNAESGLDLDGYGSGTRTSQTTLAGEHQFAGGASSLHQRQASLGQSLFDSTSTALSSFQKNSLSFFKRLDPSSSNTPPQSAKSDKGYVRDPFGRDESLVGAGLTDDPIANRGSSMLQRNTSEGATNGRTGGFKSQSMDCSSMLERTPSGKQRARRDPPPPKPPLPQSMSYRQSSLASSYTTQHQQQQRPSTTSSSSLSDEGGSLPASATINTNNNSWIQNLPHASSDQVAGGAEKSGENKGRMIRQNSALSAFETFDAGLGSISNKLEERPSGAGVGSNVDATNALQHINNKTLENTKKATNFDSASITSGDSNSTGETTTAEDTMNSLKKTFASIFGDKCE